jgi:transcription initiation factor TFIID TATA-box-binding protein
LFNKINFFTSFSAKLFFLKMSGFNIATPSMTTPAMQTPSIQTPSIQTPSIPTPLHNSTPFALPSTPAPNDAPTPSSRDANPYAVAGITPTLQ